LYSSFPPATIVKPEVVGVFFWNEELITMEVFEKRTIILSLTSTSSVIRFQRNRFAPGFHGSEPSLEENGC
jgi:hypothetical protein